MKTKIEDMLELEILTQLFYKMKYPVRDVCNPSLCPELHQTQRNRKSGI